MHWDGEVAFGGRMIKSFVATALLVFQKARPQDGFGHLASG